MTMLRSGGWLVLVCLSAPAAAQDTSHFGQLIGVIEPGDSVRVALSGGLFHRAQVVGVTLAVRYGVDDPTRDGAWRGFAAGAAGWALLSYVLCYPRGPVPDPSG